MSDLWMILVLLGVSIVLAVVVFNWWQEKKYRKDVEYRFSHTRTDVLAGESPGGQKAEAGQKSAAADKNAVTEDVEGWMSEPRVRQSAKFEPEFTVGDSQKAKPATAQKPANPPLNKQANETRPLPPKSTPAALNADSKQEPSIAALQQQAAQEITEAPAAVHGQQVADYAQAYDAAEAQSDVPAPGNPEQEAVFAAALPVLLHTAMDWVGVIDAPLGVMLAELEDLQAEARTFPHHATLWGQSSADAKWLDVLAMDAAAMQNKIPLSQVVCSLQLADRGGPVDQETLKRFQKSMETLARALGLSIHWQGGYEPSQQAQEIDTFCIEVDKAVEFHVLANQGMFHATKLRGLAEACGLQLSAEGRFELFNNVGELEFSVRNYEGKPFSGEMLKTTVMTGVTFQLDIPTTADSMQVFDRMV
ncbi:cell division protein ZipA C-terminal FtsZ-binding domain-containing protein, partial [Methylophilus sp.]